MSDMAYYYRAEAAENHLVCIGYPVLNYTPKGTWIDTGLGKKRFVRRESRKKFACSTIAEAVESLQRRRERQITVLAARLRRAHEELALAKMPPRIALTHLALSGATT